MIATNSIKWLLDDCCLYQASSSGDAELNIKELAGNLAYHAMMLEAHLTPKAGLVDCLSTGAHRDMDITTFIASSNALRPYMKQFVQAGCEKYYIPASKLLPYLKQVGIGAEHAMFDATQGVNTHKGMIFTLGLICGAVGWLYKNNRPFDALHIRHVIRECCAGLVQDELERQRHNTATTAGERLFKLHGFTGIRGEAALGYPTIFNYGLPVYQTMVSQGRSEEQALSHTLLSIMSMNNDTNLVNRGGVEGLKYVQSEVRTLLSTWDGERSAEECEQDIVVLDGKLVEKNLSPGGSADLLAATWLFAQLNSCCHS
jgi:triphosphoribosyl-dephospho-CoA synthase